VGELLRKRRENPGPIFFNKNPGLPEQAFIFFLTNSFAKVLVLFSTYEKLANCLHVQRMF
jgi:hypothetical protein